MRGDLRRAGMKLRKLAKDPGSNTGECPSVYVAEDDPSVMVVQGKRLDADTTAELHDVLADETAVRISAATIVRAVEKYLAERERA
jgi:hypothetical protein